MRAALLALLLAAAAPSFRARVLSVAAREDLDRFIKGGVLARMGVAHRGTVRPGQKTLFPIVAEKVTEGATLIADFRVSASDGRVVLRRPGCCRASHGRTPGLYVLEPVPEMIFLPSDLEGLYTASVVIWDDAGAERRAAERLVLTQ